MFLTQHKMIAEYRVQHKMFVRLFRYLSELPKLFVRLFRYLSELPKLFVRLFRYLSELPKLFVRLFRYLSELPKPAYFIVLILLTIFFSSCQKVIDVDIKNVEKKYVVEAVITDQQDSSKVLISTTKNVSENNDFPGISGAVVTVTDDTGIVTSFTEDSAGYYYAHSFKGAIGKTYALRVIVNGETFTASSVMPPKVNMDTLFISDELLFGEERKLANTTYQDPPGKGNCYRYVQYINGKKEKTIFTNNDDYTDGKYVEAKLWYLADDEEEDQKIKSGDTIRLDLFCIDPAVYKYWFSLNQSATGNSQSASPANAVTNITGGALGYFSAHSVQSKTVIAP